MQILCKLNFLINSFFKARLLTITFSDFLNKNLKIKSLKTLLDQPLAELFDLTIILTPIILHKIIA